jgi:predicted nucleic acid-binding protein
VAISSCLVDTNILLRLTRRADPQHQIASLALAQLIAQGAALYYTHQNIAELWNAMTRPQTRNGLGLAVDEADHEARVIETGMTLLPDNEAVYREWRRIVLSIGCKAFRYTMLAWRLPCTFMVWNTFLR